MTCEVAVMNQYSIAIASDSAITSTTIIRGKSETRYLKGGNKIFQTSHHEPVGTMIYGSASLQDIPWEIILKAFRDHLAKTTFATLEEYGAALFDFIRHNARLFPPAKRKEDFEGLVWSAASQIVADAISAHPLLGDVNTDQQQRKADWQSYTAALQTRLAAIPLPASFTDAEVTDAMQNFVPTFAAQVNAAFPGTPLEQIANAEALVKLAVDKLYKEYEAVFGNSTGLVIAGFGKEEYFPSFFEYECFGFIRDTLVSRKSSEKAITSKNASVIQAFATTSMVDTFLQGFGLGLWLAITDEFKAAAHQLSTKILAEVKQAAPANLDQLIKDILTDYRGKWTNRMYADHYTPIKTVIASLPIDDMAELAETLVMLESLKERVTQSTASVSGPIDVAVITKTEGLVWIKRKLYFDADKNPRYFMRQREHY